jgi:hypothetical protein
MLSKSGLGNMMGMTMKKKMNDEDKKVKTPIVKSKSSSKSSTTSSKKKTHVASDEDDDEDEEEEDEEEEIVEESVTKLIQPLNANSTSGQATALKEFKSMLSILEAEMNADQSINVENLSVQECVNLMMEKLVNCNDDFFEAYEYWQRRVPNSDTEFNFVD